MNNYETRKEQARETAIEWQLGFAENDYSYLDLAQFGDYFEKIGRRYGLLKEFRENGIL